MTGLTQDGQPAGDFGINLIQDDDDDDIDDGCSAFDSGSDVGAPCGAAHMQGSLNADPVQDDTKGHGKRQGDLEEKEETSQMTICLRKNKGKLV